MVDLCAGDGGSAVSAMCLGRNCILSDLNLDTLVTCIQFLHDHAHVSGLFASLHTLSWLLAISHCD